MRFVVTGRVHPERAAVTFSQVRGDLENGSFVASCDASELCIVIDSPGLPNAHSAKLAAEECAHVIVASLGFSLGSCYSVEAIQVIEGDGRASVFGVRNEALVFSDSNGIFNRAIVLAGKDVFFRVALRDYVRAINDAADCAPYCYRAIEAIKSAFAFRTNTEGWEEMHRSLGTSREEITTHVKEFADPARHGNWIRARATNGEQRTRMLTIARTVLERYLGFAA